MDGTKRTMRMEIKTLCTPLGFITSLHHRQRGEVDGEFSPTNTRCSVLEGGLRLLVAIHHDELLLSYSLQAVASKIVKILKLQFHPRFLGRNFELIDGGRRRGRLNFPGQALRAIASRRPYAGIQQTAGRIENGCA